MGISTSRYLSLILYNCSVCGELASDLEVVPLLIGFGVDEFINNTNIKTND